MVDGLLSGPGQRNCPRGHGPLDPLPGWFALHGVEPVPRMGLLAPHAAGLPDAFKSTGQVLPLKVWRCPTCGFVELSEKE